MKPVSELDHYELLEVPRNARREEIERAYRLVQAAYAEDSLGVYSIFDGRETAAIRQKIEIARRVLLDADSRGSLR